MSLNTRLRWTVVIRSHDQQASNTQLSGFFCHVNRMQRVVSASSGDDRNRDCFGDRSKQTQSLIVSEHRCFASCASNNQGIVAVVLKPTGQPTGSIKVECTTCIKWRHHCSDHPSKAGHQNEPSAARSMPCVKMRSSCSSIQTSWNDPHMTPVNMLFAPPTTILQVESRRGT